MPPSPLHSGEVSGQVLHHENRLHLLVSDLCSFSFKSQPRSTNLGFKILGFFVLMFLAFLFVLVFLFRFPFLVVESPLGAVLRKNKVFGGFFVERPGASR